MKSAVSMVREFHEKMGAPVDAGHGTRWPLRMRLIREELQELDESNRAGGEVEAADALADLCYVVIGTAVEWGVPLAEVFAEVHRSNMTKSASDVRGDGKILKGPQFKPPRIAEILQGKLCGFCGGAKVQAIRDDVKSWCARCTRFPKFTVAPLSELYEQLRPLTKHDPVNRPSHYVAGKFECLEVTEALGFHRDHYVASAFAYLWRCKAKGNELQDLAKAKFYIERRIAELEAKG